MDKLPGWWPDPADPAAGRTWLAEVWAEADFADASTTRDQSDKRAALQRAVNTYTGDLAATAGWPWLAAHRERRHRQLLDAVHWLTESDRRPDGTSDVDSTATRQ